MDVALAAAFSSSFAGNASNVDGFTLQAQEAAFSQVESAVLERSEWTVGGLPAVNFYAVRDTMHPLLSGTQHAACMLASN